MADYFTHFSCLIDVGSPDKAARALTLFQELQETDQDADDPEVAGFDLVRQDAPEGRTLWIHDDDHGDVEAVIRFVQRLAQELDLTGLWGFQYGLCRIRHKAYYAGIRIMPHGPPVDEKHRLGILPDRPKILGAADRLHGPEPSVSCQGVRHNPCCASNMEKANGQENPANLPRPLLQFVRGEPRADAHSA